MSVRNVVKIGSETLRKKSKPVVNFDDSLHTLLDDMKNTMVEKNGVGIAAVQVGTLRRAIIVEVKEGEYLEIVNPVIIKTKGKVTDSEGCLSIPDFFCDVTRPKYVMIKAQDRNGKEFTFEAKDYTARCVCHEIDHLDGILFVDYTDEGKKYRSKFEGKG